MLKYNIGWRDKIINVMEPGKWMSRKQIKIAVGLDHQKDGRTKTNALGGYLLRLIRSGHVVRALAPELIKRDPNDHVTYVYKRTNKVYRYKLKKLYEK